MFQERKRNMKKVKEIDLKSLKKTFEEMDSDKGRLGLTL